MQFHIYNPLHSGGKQGPIYATQSTNNCYTVLWLIVIIKNFQYPPGLNSVILNVEAMCFTETSVQTKYSQSS
jgi:hypothetical protein